MLFTLNAKLIKSETLSVINQNSPLPISKNRIEGCKRGRKNKLRVVEVDDFEAFWNHILIPNLKQKHQVAPVHSLEEITALKEKFPDNIKQYNVYHNHKIVAGTTMFLIKNVFAEKAYFDFGSSNENNGKHINTGLQFWKEGFGARTVVQEFYSVNTGSYNKLKSVMV